MSVKTRKVKNRAATALRMAAQSLYRSQSSLGHFYRRMRAKLGAPKAITATAHKLARIIYHIVTTGHAYDETICAQNEVHNRQRMEARLRKQAREFGLQPLPITTEVPQIPMPSGSASGAKTIVDANRQRTTSVCKLPRRLIKRIHVHARVAGEHGVQQCAVRAEGESRGFCGHRNEIPSILHLLRIKMDPCHVNSLCRRVGQEEIFSGGVDLNIVRRLASR